MENPITLAITAALLTGGIVVSAEELSQREAEIIQVVETEILGPYNEMNATYGSVVELLKG